MSLKGILKQRTEDLDVKKFALRCMEETESFEYTKQTLKKYYIMLQQQIAELGGNVGLGMMSYDVYTRTNICIVHIIDQLAAGGNLNFAS